MIEHLYTSLPGRDRWMINPQQRQRQWQVSTHPVVCPYAARLQVKQHRPLYVCLLGHIAVPPDHRETTGHGTSLTNKHPSTQSRMWNTCRYRLGGCETFPVTAERRPTELHWQIVTFPQKILTIDSTCVVCCELIKSRKYWPLYYIRHSSDSSFTCFEVTL